MDLLNVHGIGGAPIRATNQLVLTPTTTDIVKPGGNYTKGFKVPGEPNLVAANLVAGKSYFGVQGGATIESLGGKKYINGNVITNDHSSADIYLAFVPQVVVFTIVGTTNFIAICRKGNHTSGNMSVTFYDNNRVSISCSVNDLFPNRQINYEIYG